MNESYVEVREDGSVRLAGTLAYPEATVADVLTVQADGSIAAAAGGGSSSVVSCVLDLSPGPTITTVAVYPLEWSALYDNYYDQNALVGLPAGLGLTASFDGTSNALTTTEAGVWALTFYLSVAADAAWVGRFSFSGDFGLNVYPIQAGSHSTAAETVLAMTVGLPSGALLEPALATIVEAAAPLTLSEAALLISRLA